MLLNEWIKHVKWFLINVVLLKGKRWVSRSLDLSTRFPGPWQSLAKSSEATSSSSSPVFTLLCHPYLERFWTQRFISNEWHMEQGTDTSSDIRWSKIHLANPLPSLAYFDWSHLPHWAAGWRFPHVKTSSSHWQRTESSNLNAWEKLRHRGRVSLDVGSLKMNCDTLLVGM